MPENEEFQVEDAESIRKQGKNYESFLYQTLTIGTQKIENLFRMPNSPESNAGIRAIVFNIHFAITFRRASMDYTEKFYPQIRQDLLKYQQAANAGSGNLMNTARNDYQTVVEKWLDRLAIEARRNRFTPPESGTLVIGSGVTINPRTNKV